MVQRQSEMLEGRRRCNGRQLAGLGLRQSTACVSDSPGIRTGLASVREHQDTGVASG